MLVVFTLGVMASDGSCQQSVNSCTSRSSALAVVPYDVDKISNFHHTEREFSFGQSTIVIRQNWRDVGVAAVVWDAVC